METLNDLKKIAKEQNLKNYQNLTKQALAQRLGIPIFFSKKYYQNIAKERKIKNYQNLKKSDLIKLLNSGPETPPKPIPAPRMKRPIPAPRMKRPIPAPRNLLNIKNPEINVPILQPEIAVVKEKEAPTVIKKTTETVLGWMDWLKESGKKIIKPVSDALKKCKKKINAIFEEKKFEVKKGQSALKNFVREYIIDGKTGYDPQRFFESVRDLLIKILEENKNTKTKMIFICKMQRTDLKTGEIIEIDADFHSEIEKNLAETDENKLLDKMIARIGEILANFQQSGSNWVFQSVGQLEIHFANWKPLGG